MHRTKCLVSVTWLTKSQLSTNTWADVQIDWLKEPWTPDLVDSDAAAAAADGDDEDGSSNEIAVPTIIAAGKATMIADRRYRVYRPHNSALSVLIIRRVTKHDAGVYRCNLAGSSTRQKYLVLNVTGRSPISPFLFAYLHSLRSSTRIISSVCLHVAIRSCSTNRFRHTFNVCLQCVTRITVKMIRINYKTVNCATGRANL